MPAETTEKTTKKARTGAVGGKKKKLSAYNIFIKAELARLKESDPESTHKERFLDATKNWKLSSENPNQTAAV